MGKLRGERWLGEIAIPFKTNVPGIGIRFWIMGHHLLNTETTLDNSNINHKATIVVQPGGAGKVTTGLQYAHLRNMSFMLVKTGNISPGIINGVSLPTVEYRVYPAEGETIGKLPARYMIINFSGGINITAPTCTTPSTVDVDLGTFTTTQMNNTTSTPWKDASIKLTNCQQFFGYQKQGTDAMYDQDKVSGAYDVGMSAAAPMVNNVLGITLNSNQKNIDTAQGIVGTKTGGGEAQGVAVQIAKGSVSSNVPAPLAQRFEQTIPMSGSANITIPLVVRMIKQGSVTAGRVNAQITYTIDYQ